MNKSKQVSDYQQLFFHGMLWIILSILLGLPLYMSQHFSLRLFVLEWLTYVALFYLNYLFLVPRYLLKKKYLIYFLTIVIVIASLTWLRIQWVEPFFQKKEIPFMVHEGMKIKIPKMQGPEPPFMHFALSFNYLVIAFISTIIKILYEFNHNFQNRIMAESERKTAELNYLRKQTNPHFLFNSLNSIYSLAIKKSDLVPDAIVTLSELMRYMLYETDQRVVSLEKEINYIVNYIELQKLRIHDIENVRVNITGEMKEKMIEPLLLISFIENAFKYGTDYKGKTHVRLKISLEGSWLNFYIENTICRQTEDLVNSGIGVQNIQSRLELLYPKSHLLKIEEVDGFYKVNLQLNLDENNPVF